jgi:hypothetical protein
MGDNLKITGLKLDNPSVPVSSVLRPSHTQAPVNSSISLATLRHSNLENNSMFNELKSYLEEYYIERQRPPPHHSNNSRSQQWKQVLFTSLQALLSEVTFTQDSKMQLTLLDRVYRWYKQKTTSKSQLPPIPTKSSGNTTASTMAPSSPLDDKSALIFKPPSPEPYSSALTTSARSFSPQPIHTSEPKSPIKIKPVLRPNTYGTYITAIKDDEQDDKIQLRFIEMRKQENLDKKAADAKKSKI